MPNVPEVFQEAIVIPPGSITAEFLAAESVTLAKVKPATLPAVAAEKTVKVGEPGGDRAVIANYTSDGTASQKFKIKHGLKTQSVITTIQTNVSSKPGEQITTTLPKITAINENEIEIELAASGQPAAGVTQWVKVKG